MHRLTGSLALSIAYGIEAENPDNEFFRMYHDVLGAISEALVPGTFLVDVFPLRGSSRSNVDCWRALPNGSLKQSNIYLRGSPAYDSTHVQTKLRMTSTSLRLVQ